MNISKQIAILLGLSMFLGLSRNFLLDEPLVLIKKPRELAEIEMNVSDSSNIQFSIPEFLTEPMLIKHQAALLFHNDGNAVFIDARESEEFEEGHITSAINIPYDYLEEYEFQLDELDEETILITYCGGGECDLSIDLADYLMNDRGFFTVLVYEGGWPEWQQHLEFP